MTENRFNYRIRKETTQYEIYDNWKTGEYPFIEPFFYKHSAKKICEFLNNLNDENEQLKKENKGIQNKVWRLLNWLSNVEKCITKEQVKEWWNKEMENDDQINERS